MLCGVPVRGRDGRREEPDQDEFGEEEQLVLLIRQQVHGPLREVLGLAEGSGGHLLLGTHHQGKDAGLQRAGVHAPGLRFHVVQRLDQVGVVTGQRERHQFQQLAAVPGTGQDGGRIGRMRCGDPLPGAAELSRVSGDLLR